MWYPASLAAVAGGSDAVTRAQAASQVGVTLGNDPADLLIATARGHVENYCGLVVVARAATLKCDAFCDLARLPIAPVRSITSITYLDDDGAEQTLPTSVYELRSDGLIARVVLKYNQAWPSIQPGSRITVVAAAGYLDAASTPGEIKSAILLQISKIYSVSRADPMLRARTIEGVGSRQWDTSGQALEVVDRAVADLLENYRCFPA